MFSIEIEQHWRGVQRPGFDPAGAVVTIKAGPLLLTRVLLLGSSFQSSEDPRLLFGLGKHQKIDSLVVTWPNGEKSEHSIDSVDRIVSIVYPDK